MKLTRLTLLLLVLVSVVVAGEAFGGGGGGKLFPVQGDGSQAEEEAAAYTIICLDGRTTPCSGSYDYCVGYCDGWCGGGPGSCA
jgi:hypothetical protein